MSIISSITQDLTTHQAQAAKFADSQRKLEGAGNAKDAATEFEAVFLSQMLGLMFEQLPTDGPFGGGHGEQVFRSLLTDQYSRMMAQQGGIGLSDAVQKEILKLQEDASHV